MSEPLENERHERFAVYLAQGFAPPIAYENAGYAHNATTAKALARRPHISDRVYALQKEMEENLAAQDDSLTTGRGTNDELNIDDVTEDEAEALVTRKWLLRQLTMNITKARQAGQFSASNKAIEMMGNYLGGIFDKKVAATNGATISSVTAEQTSEQRTQLLEFANALRDIATEPDAG